MSFEIDRHRYLELFGPTKGDKIRLGDTDLIIEIEKDYTGYGDECKFGGGKVLRDGMGQNAIESRENPMVADLIITGATVVDYTGIYKADIGIRDGKILAIGKGGNPYTMDDVDFIVAPSTEALAGEGRIITAGGIDTHVHYISPDVVNAALEGGITTLIGGGTGPVDGTNAVTSTPGKWNIHRMLQSAENFPINLGFLGKGSGANIRVTAEQIEAGACGLKVHEDWGATRSAIDYSLKTADEYDVQVAIHTDTLNEGGFVEHTIEAIAGRTIHTYHTEGAGGGHAYLAEQQHVPSARRGADRRGSTRRASGNGAGRVSDHAGERALRRAPLRMTPSYKERERALQHGTAEDLHDDQARRRAQRPHRRDRQPLRARGPQDRAHGAGHGDRRAGEGQLRQAVLRRPHFLHHQRPGREDGRVRRRRGGQVPLPYGRH